MTRHRRIDVVAADEAVTLVLDEYQVDHLDRYVAKGLHRAIGFPYVATLVRHDSTPAVVVLGAAWRRP